MTTITLSWKEFLKEAEEFLKLSKALNDDGWNLLIKNDNEGNTYLSYKHKIQSKKKRVASSLDEDLTDVTEQYSDSAEVVQNRSEIGTLQMEYHIVYSISYQVPVLYLRAQRSDGSLLEMEEIWEIFGTTDEEIPKSRQDMLSVLTQMEHPVLFKPYFAIHPCRTAELLGNTAKSRNRVLTFISLMGPYVKLKLNNQYGLLVQGQKD